MLKISETSTTRYRLDKYYTLQAEQSHNQYTRDSQHRTKSIIQHLLVLFTGFLFCSHPLRAKIMQLRRYMYDRRSCITMSLQQRKIRSKLTSAGLGEFGRPGAPASRLIRRASFALSRSSQQCSSQKSDGDEEG